jgi:hypothetical protein
VNITFHLQPKTHKAQILSRHTEGFDIPGRKCTVTARPTGIRMGERTTIHVPGHREVAGYDRMNGGNQYHYVRAARYVVEPVEIDDDGYGNQIVTAKVIS